MSVTGVLLYRMDKDNIRTGIYYLTISLLLSCHCFMYCSGRVSSTYTFEEWERGIAIIPEHEPSMRVYVWFYEWNLFDAVLPGIHTHAPRDYKNYKKKINQTGSKAEIRREGMHLTFQSGDDGVDMILDIRNDTEHTFPDIAAVIPCFNAGPPARYKELHEKYPLNRNFVDTDSLYTYFIGPEGITLLNNRHIHFNVKYRSEIEKVRTDTVIFPFDNKWPTSSIDAYAGLLLRESVDKQWVTGIAWDEYISVQGHNPWYCMHLSIRVGPLTPGQTKRIRGKIYLFKGTPEDCLQKFQHDFSKNHIQPAG